MCLIYPFYTRCANQSPKNPIPSFLFTRSHCHIELFVYQICAWPFFITGHRSDSIHTEALRLVDSVLEQSLNIVNAKQKDREVYRDAQIIMNRTTTEQYDIDETMTTLGTASVDTYPESVATTARSDSGEPFAITCDVTGVDLLKSPTIESMSGKSFDDNISMPDYSVSHHDEALDSSDRSPVKLMHQTDRIDRKFERLSSQLLETDDVTESAALTDDFEQALIGSAILNSDEVNNCQSDFSKISWGDDSASATTAGDGALGTPDNDIQELPKGDYKTTTTQRSFARIV